MSSLIIIDTGKTNKYASWNPAMFSLSMSQYNIKRGGGQRRMEE
jgi:hypothetical protein